MMKIIWNIRKKKCMAMHVPCVCHVVNWSPVHFMVNTKILIYKHTHNVFTKYSFHSRRLTSLWSSTQFDEWERKLDSKCALSQDLSIVLKSTHCPLHAYIYLYIFIYTIMIYKSYWIAHEIWIVIIFLSFFDFFLHTNILNI